MTSMALLQLFWHFTNWQSSSSNYPVKRRLGNLHICFSWLVLISPFDLKKKAKSTVYLTSNIMNNYCSEVMQTKNQAPDKVWIYLTFNGNFETFQWPLNTYLILYSLSLSLSNTDTHTHTHTHMHAHIQSLLTHMKLYTEPGNAWKLDKWQWYKFCQTHLHSKPKYANC